MKTLLRCALAGLWFLAEGHAQLRDHGAPTLSAIPDAFRTTSSGERHLPSGHVAQYEYHYDRNALRAAHISPADILAVTEAGTLLRYDPSTLRATAELVPAHTEASCIGDDAAGRPLVGLADGRVCRAEAAPMQLEEIGRVAGRLIWVGGAREGGDGRRVVLCASEVLRKGLGDPSKVEIHVLGHGKVGEINGPAMASFSAFLDDLMCIPITKMLQDKQEPGFTVFASNNVYRASPDFKQWKKTGTVTARLWGGRPDAIGCYPGMRAIVEWRKGKPKLIAKEMNNSHWVEATFLTPDGGIWETGFGQFRRWDGRKWVALHALTNSLWRVAAVNSRGPPWILFGYSMEGGALARLSHGPAFEKPALTRFVAKDDDGTALAVRDARPWGDGLVILATDRGVRILRPDRDVASKPDFPTPAGGVQRLCRDGRGRLWFAGDGVWLLDDGALVDLSDLPMFGKKTCSCPERDPDNLDRVAVGLGRHGMVLISVAKGQDGAMRTTHRHDIVTATTTVHE